MPEEKTFVLDPSLLWASTYIKSSTNPNPPTLYPHEIIPYTPITEQLPPEGEGAWHFDQSYEWPEEYFNDSQEICIPWTDITVTPVEYAWHAILRVPPRKMGIIEDAWHVMLAPNLNKLGQVESDRHIIVGPHIGKLGQVESDRHILFGMQTPGRLGVAEDDIGLILWDEIPLSWWNLTHAGVGIMDVTVNFPAGLNRPPIEDIDWSLSYAGPRTAMGPQTYPFSFVVPNGLGSPIFLRIKRNGYWSPISPPKWLPVAVKEPAQLVPTSAGTFTTGDVIFDANAEYLVVVTGYNSSLTTIVGAVGYTPSGGTLITPTLLHDGFLNRVHTKAFLVPAGQAANFTVTAEHLGTTRMMVVIYKVLHGLRTKRSLLTTAATTAIGKVSAVFPAVAEKTVLLGVMSIPAGGRNSMLHDWKRGSDIRPIVNNVRLPSSTYLTAISQQGGDNLERTLYVEGTFEGYRSLVGIELGV